VLEVAANRLSVQTYVDFCLPGASVICVNITGVKKVLAAFVVTCFLVLGGFTVGLAQGTPALGIFLTAELNHELPGGAVQLHRYTPMLGITSETGSLPFTYKYPGRCQQVRVLSARREVDKRLPMGAQIPTHKVSLHILQSVLLL
jgi:hypothetical protein